MGIGLELITGFVTAPGSTLTALTMASGNSATVRSATFGKKVMMLEHWAFCQVAGTSRARSPRLHDANQGIRYQITANQVFPRFPIGLQQPLYPQDTMTLELSGSGVGGQIETSSYLLWYEDVLGIQARMTTADDVMKRGLNLETAEVVCAAGVAGGYSGQVAINSSFDNFKANTDYALVGGQVRTQCACARIQGIDTGNLGVGFPGEPSLAHLTNYWFWRLSKETGIPLIPIFNSANKFGILADVAQNQAGASVTVTWNFVELSK